MPPSRREFVAGAAGLGALAALSCATRANQDAPQPPRFSISLAEWSYHRALRSGAMKHEDFARVAREVHGLDAVEYVNTFFQDKARDGAYLDALRKGAADVGSRILLVMIDAEGELGHADAGERTRSVQNHVRWLEAAKRLGCHSIRVNAGGSGPREEHAKRAAESLAKLGDLAAPLDLSVIVENHGGPSSDGAWLLGVMKLAAHPRVGTLPDFGNFRVSATEEYDRYKGVAELMPFARAVSAKSHDFDEAGNETHTDYARMLKIVLDAGYRGYVGIEYEGDRLDERAGVEATRKLLVRVRETLA